MIHTTAARLQPGQRVKLRHTKRLWQCVESCETGMSGYACVRIGSRKLWLSPGSKVLIPLEDDPVLGGATQR